VTRLVDEIRAALGQELAGVYLHGSLAMGCFNPARSDVDLLVVIERGMAVETKRRIVEALLSISNKPRPIEISFLRRSDVHPWRHPASFDLHYGEGAWRERIQRELASEDWRRWNETLRHDPDLAAHITVTHARGIVLLGAPIDDVFPVVPAADYYDSIYGDFRGILDRPDENPVYSVLNASRVLGYAARGDVMSKAEGGAWALEVAPTEYRDLIALALDIYTGRRSEAPFDSDVLNGFLHYVERRLPRGVSADEGLPPHLAGTLLRQRRPNAGDVWP
jgi:streptomycin 3"-adenylyltransferase